MAAAPCTKMAFTSAAYARAFVRDRSINGSHPRLRPYRCGRCGLHHLTHLTPAQYRRRVRLYERKRRSNPQGGGAAGEEAEP